MDRTLKILDDITGLFGLDELGPVPETEDYEGIRPREMVVGLTEEEYWAVLKAVRDKQRADDFALGAADQVPDEGIEEAEVIQDDVA